MSLIARKRPLEDELWNVSLLPAATLPMAGDAPHGPAPRGGRSLRAPALLSEQDDVGQPVAEAA